MRSSRNSGEVDISASLDPCRFQGHDDRAAVAEQLLRHRADMLRGFAGWPAQGQSEAGDVAACQPTSNRAGAGGGELLLIGGGAVSMMRTILAACSNEAQSASREGCAHTPPKTKNRPDERPGHGDRPARDPSARNAVQWSRVWPERDVHPRRHLGLEGIAAIANGAMTTERQPWSLPPACGAGG